MDITGRDLSRARRSPSTRIAECWDRARHSHAVASPAAQLGRYRLRPEQLEAIRSIRAALAEFGGALLADPPGTGKTIVALAVARSAAEVVVVAPGALRAQWERSAARAQVTTRFISMESLSRTAPGARARVARGGLVIIDEAHHLRSPSTRRYVNAAELCLGVHVLMLSATPVVNRAKDRDALVALFLAGRATIAVERCIIRRSRSGREDGMPLVKRLPVLEGGADANAAGVARRLRELPAPFPAADGAAALGLIRVSLAMAWSSSLAALDAALRRRIQRGEALADSLDAGDWPTRAALRQWIVGDDATQLALPGLEGCTTPPPAGAGAALRVHLDAVGDLRQLVAGYVEADTTARARAVRRLLMDHPARRVVVFARHATTIRALWGALRGTAGVIAVVGERVMAAEGRWRREEVLAALGPRAKPLRADDPRMIRLLLTTDLLAEGVELQGVDTLVHADLAWTPATLEQREGRVIRPSRERAPAQTREVRIAWFEAPPESVPMLRLAERLASKERSRARAVRGAECLARTDRAFGAWGATHDAGGVPPDGAPAIPPVSRARCDGFLAAVRSSDAAEFVVGGTKRDGRWRVETTPCVIARLATRPQSLPCDSRELDSIRRALARWLRRRVARSLIGSGDRAPAVRDARRWRTLSERVDRALRGWSLAERAEKGPALIRALGQLVDGGGAGTANRLSELLRELRDAGSNEFVEALERLAEEVPRPIATPDTCQRLGHIDSRRLEGRPALLALVPLVSALRSRSTPAAARPSASP